MKIIAFGHRKGTGKSTAAMLLEELLEQSGGMVNIRSFASIMKQMCHVLYAWSGLQAGEFYEFHGNEYLKDAELPKIGKSPRQIWIEFGTGVCREIYQDTFVDYLFHAYHNVDYMIVTDLRFPNEAARVLELGGLVVKVRNDRVAKTDDVADCALEGYDRWSYQLDNNGTIDDLKMNIVNMVNDLGGLVS